MIDDLDYSLDQSSRIARRIAYGTYRLTHDNQVTGEEVWGIFGLFNGGFRLMTDIDQEWPVPNQQRARLDVDAHWNVERFWVQVDVEGVRRMATCLPAHDEAELDIEIVEVRLQRDEERSNLRHTQKPPMPLRRLPNQYRADKGRLVTRTKAPYLPSTHLDFGSALFNHAVLQRVDVLLGAPVRFDSIVLTLPSLEPIQVQQEYLYERDEPIRGDPRRPLARKYSITELGDQPIVTAFWTDERGIVIAQQLEIEGAPHGCDIVDYTWAD